VCRSNIAKCQYFLLLYCIIPMRHFRSCSMHVTLKLLFGFMMGLYGKILLQVPLTSRKQVNVYCTRMLFRHSKFQYHWNWTQLNIIVTETIVKKSKSSLFWMPNLYVLRCYHTGPALGTCKTWGHVGPPNTRGASKSGWPLFFNNDFPWPKNTFPWPIGTAYFF